MGDISEIQQECDHDWEEIGNGQRQCTYPECQLITTDHKLKTDPEPFRALIEGKKTFELRKDDRKYQVRDTLTLRETVHTGVEMARGAPLRFTGRTCGRVVKHILRGPVYGLPTGYVIMSLGV